jgi:hypothetical protein
LRFGHAGFASAHTVIGSLVKINAPYKTIAMALSFLLSLGQPGVVLGHSARGSLRKKKSATDVYSVTCSNEEGGDTPTFRLAAQVRDLPRQKPLLSVTIAKDGAAAQATDKNGDGNQRYSPWAYVNGDNGVYQIIVTKSGRGVERYSLEFHCQGPSSSGYVHTGTDVRITQNQ